MPDVNRNVYLRIYILLHLIIPSDDRSTLAGLEGAAF